MGRPGCSKNSEKNHYQNTIFLNIEWNKLLHDTFDRGLDVSRITREIEGIQGRQITKDTLLIFDEIQFCPAALTSLKYFAEEKTGDSHRLCRFFIGGTSLVYGNKPLILGWKNP